MTDETTETEPNWEGLPGSPSEHRTVGPVRAFCLIDSEWCYEHALCPCCDQVKVPKRWREFHPAELLHELTLAINEEVPHAPACPGGAGCWCPVSAMLRLLEGVES